MKKRKRSLLKTILLTVLRYERWKMNPKNMYTVFTLEQTFKGL